MKVDPKDHLTSFLRWGPYLLLALATAVSVATIGEFHLSRPEVVVMLVLTAALAVLHRWCADGRWTAQLDDAVGGAYVVTRTVLAFVVTWINPFYAVFALVGYFDAHLYLPRRWKVVAVATAVTMAGSQSGGLPPSTWLQCGLFIGLFAINGFLVVMFAGISQQEADAVLVKEATIGKLEQALAENAALQARLVEQARQSGVHEERERLALEIHDTIAQNLTGIVTQLQAVTDTSDGAASREHVKRAADLAREALGEARRSVQGLLPLRLDSTDVVGALTHLTRDWSASTGVQSELVVTGDVEPLHQDIESTVLRVAQEALTNISKHARAQRVGVTLSYTDDELVLDVRDDGAGFDPVSSHAPDGHGVGLHGMHQRAARVAGELVVESEPRAGTAVSLRVPSVPHA